MTDSSDIEGTITKSDVLVDYVTAINVVIVTYEISFWYEQMAFQSLTVHGVDCYDDSRPLFSLCFSSFLPLFFVTIFSHRRIARIGTPLSGPRWPSWGPLAAIWDI